MTEAVTELRQELKCSLDFILETINSNDSLPHLPRSDYYYWKNRIDPDTKKSDLMDAITNIYANHHKRYGYRRITLQLKHMDSAAHKAATGVPNEIILENAKKIAQAGGKLQIRIPVIPRFNNDPENIRRTGEFCRELGAAVELIQLLPYHSMGNMKYFRLDENAKVMEAVPPSDAEMERHKAALQEMGLPVTIH